MTDQGWGDSQPSSGQGRSDSQSPSGQRESDSQAANGQGGSDSHMRYDPLAAIMAIQSGAWDASLLRIKAAVDTRRATTAYRDHLVAGLTPPEDQHE